MEKVVLKAEKREVIGKQVGAMRREGKLPAVIYGKNLDPISIVLDTRSASKILNKATSSSLVMIEVDGKEYPTLVREKQRDYIKNVLLHVDFLAVSLTEKIRANISLRFTGVSIAVKDFNAVLVHNIEQFHVESVATDLPEFITVDISKLARVGDGIRVKDVSVSDKVHVLDDPEIMVAVATAPKISEEVASVTDAVVVGAPASGEPELSVDRGKKEDDEE